MAIVLPPYLACLDVDLKFPPLPDPLSGWGGGHTLPFFFFFLPFLCFEVFIRKDTKAAVSRAKLAEPNRNETEAEQG